MFFGTLEIAWIASGDILSFAEGCKKGFLVKGKQKNFVRALEQVGMWKMIEAVLSVKA